MADNYLERQYEAYEKRKAEWEKAKRLGLVKKNGQSTSTTSPGK